MAKIKTTYKIALNKLSLLERQLFDIYKQSLESVEKQMANIFKQYSTNGILTGNEMAKYNRLNNLYDSLTKAIKTLGATQIRTIYKMNKSVYEETFFRDGFEIQGLANVGIRWGKVTADGVRSAIGEPLPGRTLKDMIQYVSNQQIQQIKNAVASGIAQGLQLGKVVKQLKSIYMGDKKGGQVFGGALARAIRTARTETLRSYSQADLDSYQEATDKGIKMKKIWDATLDDRTRPDHIAMDGREADSEGMFLLPDGSRGEAPRKTGVASQDINCRCHLRFEVEDVSKELRVRRARNVEDGKNFVMRYKSFEDYAKGQNLKYTSYDTLKKQYQESKK